MQHCWTVTLLLQVGGSYVEGTPDLLVEIPLLPSPSPLAANDNDIGRPAIAQTSRVQSEIRRLGLGLVCHTEGFHPVTADIARAPPPHTSASPMCVYVCVCVCVCVFIYPINITLFFALPQFTLLPLFFRSCYILTPLIKLMHPCSHLSVFPHVAPAAVLSSHATSQRGSSMLHMSATIAGGLTPPYPKGYRGAGYYT